MEMPSLYYLLNKKFKILLCFSCFLIGTSIVFSQNSTRQKLNEAIKNSERQIAVSNKNKIDSLLKSISITKSDTDKIKLYLVVCELCEIKDNLRYSEPVFQLTDKLLPITKNKSDIKRLMQWRYEALNFVRYFYESQNQNSPQLEKFYQNHIKIALRYNDFNGYSNTIISLADFYFKQGNMIKRLRCMEVGYKRTNLAKQYTDVSIMLVRLAFFYAENNDTTSALKYIEKAIANEKLINDKSRNNRAYIIRGNLYRDLGKYSQALKEYDAAIVEYSKAKDTSALSDIYRQIGYLYQKSKEYQKAIENFNKGEKLAQSNNDFGLLVQFLIAKGEALASLGRLDEAIEEHSWLWDKIKLSLNETDNNTIVFFGSYLAKDYVLAKQFKKAKEILDKITPMATVAVEKSNLENLSFRTDSALGNYKEALIHYHNFIQVQALLNDAEIAKSGVQRQFKEDLEKQKAEQQKQNAIVELDKKKQRIVLYAVSGGLLLLAILAGVILRSLYKTRQANKIIEEQKLQVENQKAIVEEKQKEIIDSIAYAQRLQQAILPPKQLIDNYFSDNFIYYQPKDIVAGDFYWAEKINHLLFIAAADSTGHGVPGAMVSVVCSNALNRTVKEFGLIDTGSILTKARELVIETFAKSNAEVKDGMDISLLCIDKTNTTITWSGANNPLWYIDNDKLVEIKADKQPIGKTDNPQPFSSHQITWQPNTSFYLFTDGLADQFGGPKGKKYKYKQLEDLLLSIYRKPMFEQQERIKNSFQEWKGNLEQVDDVCIIGLRI